MASGPRLDDVPPDGTGGLDVEALAYYADGAWYDAEYVHIGGDVPAYVRVASLCDGPLLELACGTGRLTLPMARAASAAVVGVDVSPGMVSRAVEKLAREPEPVRARTRFATADMRTMRLGERFDGVVLAFNTLMHMTEDEDLEAALLTVREHLSPRGLFHFDLHTPWPNLAAERDPAGRYDPQPLIDPRTGERWQVTENNHFDPRTQLNAMSFFYQRVDLRGRPFGPERQVTLRLRVIFPRELDTWLWRCGLEIVGDWEDLARTAPFTARGGRRVVSARRR